MTTGGSLPEEKTPDTNVWDRDLDSPWQRSAPARPGWRNGQTIRGWMIRIAIAAGVLGLPGLIRSAGGGLFISVLAAFVLLAAAFAVPGGLLLRRLCPVCSRPSLRRLARHRRFFRCSECRARVKLGPEGEWWDASGPEDADKYQSKAESRRWAGFTVPSDLGGTTSGRLLGNKRSRGKPTDGGDPG